MKRTMIDIHTHILPGLDDGAKNIHDSIQIAEMAVADGIQKVIATPHLFRGTESPLDWSLVQEKRDSLDKALKEQGIDLEIFLGAEVHISHDLVERIKQYRSHLVLNRSSYMLVEFPSDHIFSGIKCVFFELMTKGITPIIAHPERNSVFQRNAGLLYELCQKGALCQINSGSILGTYGSRVREAVFTFLRMNVVHFLSTDCHNTRNLVPNLSSAVQQIQEQFGDQVALALVEDNPLAVLEDRNLPFLPEPKNPDQNRKSFKIKLPWFKFRN